MGSKFKGFMGVSAAVVSMAALAAWSPAAAQSRQSDGLFVYNAAGALVASATQDETSESARAIVVVPIAIDPTQLGNATNLTEPGIDPSKGNSDIFGICSCGLDGQLALGFASDDDANLVSFGTFPRTFAETAHGFDATLYLDPTLQAQGDTAVFFSDAGGVPEPTAWALMLTGFGLAGTALRRRRPALAVA